MKPHQLSQDDRDFQAAFEACTVEPSGFTHEAHVRLAYAYLVENDVERAVQRMREALLKFLEQNGIPRSKFHETITRAWVLAVRHFMNRAQWFPSDPPARQGAKLPIDRKGFRLSVAVIACEGK